MRINWKLDFVSVTGFEWPDAGFLVPFTPATERIARNRRIEHNSYKIAFVYQNIKICVQYP